jgi:ubiquinone biosynthesis protein UbiJ
MQLPASAVTALESAINRYLRLDPDGSQRLAGLAGRCINIHLDGLELDLYLSPDAHGVQLSGSCEAAPDTVLRGTPLALARMGLGGSAEQSLFSGEVLIEGDVETGQAFKAILDDLDIDWEEQLSHLTGDIVAHRLGYLARRGREALHRSRTRLEQDVGEYLQEELQVLPTRIETDNFNSAVTRLAMDVDRLAARVQRLQQALSRAHDD